MLPHGGCYSNKSQAYPCVASNPKAGVLNVNVDTQVNFYNATDCVAALGDLNAFFEAGQLKTHVVQEYGLEDARAAYVQVAGGHTVGKVAIVISDAVV